MAEATNRRPNEKFAPGSDLSFELLQEWQDYFLQQLTLHQTKVHTFGVVSGFEIVEDRTLGHFIVEPGTAITKEGLLLVKQTRVFIRPSIFDELRRDRLRVFLVVNDEAESSSDAVRIDHVGIEVVERGNSIEGIPLGELVRGFDSVSASEKQRIRAGLISAKVVSSDKRTKFELGSNDDSEAANNLRLMVDRRPLLGGGPEPRNGSYDVLLSVHSEQVEEVAVQSSSRVELNTNLRVRGNVAVQGGALSFNRLSSDSELDFQRRN